MSIVNKTMWKYFEKSAFGFVWWFLLASTLSAGTLSCSVSATCNSPDVVIYKMSGTSNAHAELPSQSNYSNLVCCTGVGGLGNSCSGTYVTVLKLQSTSNSHVQQNNQSGYTNNACMSVSNGSVSVGYQASNCTGYDTTVGSISTTDNTHVGDGSAYTTKICATGDGTSLTFAVDSGTETLPVLTPGTLVATTSILTIKTNNPTGFNITAMRNNASATLLLNSDNSVSISDKTAWSAPVATTTAGNATASTTQTQTLQFRIRQASTAVANYASIWWGTDDTTANALFAGFPTTQQTIIKSSVSAPATTTAYALYNLDVASTQLNGAYSGGITYTAVANP